MGLLVFFAESGPWGWFILGLLLLVAELIVPGVFLIWVGIAALILGAGALVLQPFFFIPWQLQLIAFAVLAVISILVGRKLLSGRESVSDQPLLNQRAASLIGRTAIVSEAIVNGRGRIRLDDTTWTAEGPDAPAGATVRITGGDGGKLRVEPS